MNERRGCEPRFVRLNGPSETFGGDPTPLWVRPDKVLAIGVRVEGTSLFVEGLAHPLLVMDSAAEAGKRLGLRLGGAA